MKHFPCDVCQHSAENDIKFPVPVATKNVQLQNKEVETNSLKVSMNNFSLLLFIFLLHKIIKHYTKLLKYNFSFLDFQISEKDEDCRSIHNNSVSNDSGLLNDNFHDVQNQHGELRSSILTPTTIRFKYDTFFFFKFLFLISFF